MTTPYHLEQDPSGDEVVVWADDSADVIQMRIASDKLEFSGDKLRWISSSNITEYTGFSGLADMSARESVKDAGPMPQGEYAVDPSKIQPSPAGEEVAWGKRRVKSEPIRSTRDRMKICFGELRSGLYIHGGDNKGTIGCIEINDDAEEESFFDRLLSYNTKLQLIVKFEGDYETKLEEPKCPYP